MKYYFKILGIAETSSAIEIKVAYKKLMKKWHPDKFPNNEIEKQFATEKSKEINNAYDILKELVFETKKTSIKKDKNQFEWYLIKSTNIVEVGYNKFSHTLRIRFKNDRGYEYYNVPIEIFNQLLNSTSKGKFAINHIYNKFKYYQYH